MNEQTDPNSKPESAIQVRVHGVDNRGREFDEISTAFPTSKGVMLETVQQLREGTSVEITHLLTNRKAVAQVKSFGPKLGVSTLVFVEGGDVEKFWTKVFSKEAERKRKDGPGENTPPMTAADTGTLVTVPERALMHVSKPRLPNMDRFMETLHELVESALQANLRPAVEQFTHEIPEHVVKAQTSVFANLDEKIQTAVGTFSTRLDGRAREVLTQTENSFTQRIQELVEQRLRNIQSGQDEFRKNLEDALLAGKGKLNEQVESVVCEGTAKLRDALQEASGRMQQQFAESCRALAEEKQNAFGSNSQQMECEFGERLSAKVSGIFGDAAIALAERAQQVENDFGVRLTQQAQEAAERFQAELKKAFEGELPAYTARLQEQMTMSASRFREKFMEEYERELSQKQERLIRQTLGLMKELADQNQNRIAGMFRQLAQAMENQAEPVVESANAAD